VEGVQRATVLYLADWPIEEGRAKENRPTPLPWIETKPRIDVGFFPCNLENFQLSSEPG